MLLPAGVGLMAFESHVGPPVAAFPLPAFAPTDLDDAEMRPPNVATPAGFRGCHYIMAAGRELWHKAYRCFFWLLGNRCMAAAVLVLQLS